MRLICISILLLVLINGVLSAQMFGEAAVRYDKCYYSKKRMYIAPGESKPLPNCKEARCIKHKRKLYLEINSCGVVDRNCRVPGDTSLPYPYCCPRSECKVD